MKNKLNYELLEFHIQYFKPSRWAFSSRSPGAFVGSAYLNETPAHGHLRSKTQFLGIPRLFRKSDRQTKIK